MDLKTKEVEKRLIESMIKKSEEAFLMSIEVFNSQQLIIEQKGLHISFVMLENYY